MYIRIFFYKCSSILFRKLEFHDELARHQSENALLHEEVSDLKMKVEGEKADHQQNNNNLMATIGNHCNVFYSLLCYIYVLHEADVCIFNVFSVLDELTGTCQNLQDELTKCTGEVERVTKTLVMAEDETKAVKDHNTALQGRLDSVSETVGLQCFHSLISSKWNYFWRHFFV